MRCISTTMPSDLLHFALVFTTAVLVYSNTFTADFVYDDSQAIVSNPVVNGQLPAAHAWTLDFWGNRLSRGSHKSYRPLTTLSFRLNAALFGMKPLSFHATNVLLHGVASSLVLVLVRRLQLFTKNPEAGLFTSLLFAVHPIHCEAVAGVVGRADVLAAIAVLTGIVLYQRSQSINVAAVSTAVAVCFKESGIMLPPLLGVLVLLRPRKAPSEVRRIASSLFLVFLAMAASRHAINSFEAPSFSKADNPVAHHPSQLFRLLTFLYLPVFHLQLLIYPKVLSFDWSMDAIPLVVSPIDSRFLASIAFYACLAVACCTLIKHGGVVEDVILAIKQKRPNRTISCPSKDSTSRGRKFEKRESCQNVLIALALLILPFIPASNLFYYVGFVAAERTLYLPSVGYCILAGMLYSFSASRGGKNLALSAGLAILIVHGTRTWERNKDWRDEESLYRSALDINPPKAFSNLGRIYASQMRLDDAEAAYRSAIAHRPNMADTWYNLGVLYQEKKNLSEAIKCYSTAIQFRRTFAIAHLNLGIALESLNHENQAMLIWQTCSAIDGSLVKAQREHQNAQTSCRLRLARLLLRRRELRHVQIVLEEAIRQAPQFYPHVHSLLCTLGELYGILGQPSRAEQLFQAAFEASPTHVPTLLTMAHLYNKQNRTFESRTWFGKALAIAPNSADVYHHIGVAAAARGDLSEAEHAYRNALGIVGSHVDSLKALATILREQQRNDESEEVLRRLIHYHPTAEALGDYGAILHLNGKLAEAKYFYEKSLTLDSDNKLTRENLRRLQRKIASSSKYS